MRKFRVSFMFLISIFTLALYLHSVGAESFGLAVQDAEIAPAVAKIGELVSVNVTIKNCGKNTTSCNVTTFCGDCVVGIRGISNIAPKDAIPLSFKLDTSNLSTGVYSIEALIKKPSDEQKTFDLGNLTIEQDDPTIPEEATEPQPNSTNPPDPNNTPSDTNPTDPEKSSTATTGYSSKQYLLAVALLPLVIPAGVIASILVLRKQNKIFIPNRAYTQRNNSQEPTTHTPEMEILEKEFEKQFGFRKAKVSLIICAGVLALTISSLWLFT